MRAATAAGFLLVLCISAPVRASQAENGTLSLLVENDVFFNTDRDYTNGLMASYTLGPDATPHWLNEAVCEFPLFDVEAGECSTADVRRIVELGQNMYTPTDITLPNPPMTDRPYAGFLYLGLGFVTDTGSE